MALTIGLGAVALAVVALCARWLVRSWRKDRADEARQEVAQQQVDAQAAAIEQERQRRDHRELAKQQADEAARRDAAGGLGDQLRRDVDAAGARPPHRPGPR